MNMKRLIYLLVISVVIFGAGSAFAGSVMDKDVIRVGTEATYPPFEFRNQDNEMTGFDIELVQAIGEHMEKDV